MKNKFTGLLVSLIISIAGFGQPCVQPGSLISVKNFSDENVDYIIFEFVNPYSSKGILGNTNSALFPFSTGRNSSFHKIVFDNVRFVCYNSLNLEIPTSRILDFKTEQKTATMVSYVFELAEGAIITKHLVSQQENVFLVKIKIEQPQD